ncbi:hypothetical protein ABN763_14390 [Spongiivirga sp. MCCC 1A20706]|uniref:hypothetical protein n=1 Tax=Spongiivirga sp. MCCC 1A20706 TaxID=3160963 RepID=UPI0039775E5D
MTITKQSTLLLLIIATLFSCNKIDELTEFDVTDGFSTTMSVSIPDESTEAQTFSETSTIDILSNQDIQENLNLIQDININSLTYEITNFTGAQNTTITNASLSFGDLGINVDEINPQTADEAGTVYTITDTDLLRNIASILKSSGSITATLEGTVSSTPINFDIAIKLDLTATIDVL